jgi:hypothetical protein
LPSAQEGVAPGACITPARRPWIETGHIYIYIYIYIRPFSCPGGRRTCACITPERRPWAARLRRGPTRPSPGPPGSPAGRRLHFSYNIYVGFDYTHGIIHLRVRQVRLRAAGFGFQAPIATGLEGPDRHRPRSRYAYTYIRACMIYMSDLTIYNIIHIHLTIRYMCMI